jgi:hypothetical protein
MYAQIGIVHMINDNAYDILYRVTLAGKTYQEETVKFLSCMLT